MTLWMEIADGILDAIPPPNVLRGYLVTHSAIGPARGERPFWGWPKLDLFSRDGRFPAVQLEH